MKDILDKLSDTLVGEVTYHEVFCEECDFTQACWLRREAELRGQVHNHNCSIHKVMLVEQKPEQLGL